MLTLQPGSVRVGRAEDNEVVLPDIGVSRRHARIVVSPDAIHVEDLGSGNGTFFRGSRIDKRVLEDGDTVVIDPFVLRFHVKQAVGDHDVAQLARLVVLSSPSVAQTSFAIGLTGATLGRSELCEIRVEDAAASRFHCDIVGVNGQYKLQDKGSANGVFVNGTRVQTEWLKDGDELRVGDTTFRFVDAELVQGDSVTQRRVDLDELTPSKRPDFSMSHDLTLPEPQAMRPNKEAKPRRGRGILAALGFVSIGAALATVILFVVLLLLLVVLYLFYVAPRQAVGVGQEPVNRWAELHPTATLEPRVNAHVLPASGVEL